MYLNEDYGAVFVREKGELRCLGVSEGRRDQRDQDSAPRRRLFSRNFSLQLCCGDTLSPASHSNRRNNFIFTYNKEGSLRYSAKSLFDISLQFIADHIEHVESLVGFPEQMAEKLFSASEERDKFANPCTGARALQLFCDAYGGLVLQSLCLRNRFHLVSERLEEIRKFQSLECLDLYGCRLGDDHGVFQYITSEALTSLVKLFVGGNCLSDTGLQRLTAPVRIMRKGLEYLQLLDISDNCITEKGLGYLTSLKMLQKVDISGTDVTVNESLKRFFKMKLRMVLSEIPLRDFEHSSCKTEGWAEQVINQWEVRASEVPKREHKPRTNALSFYGRQKFIKEALNSWTGSSSISTKKVERIHFFKVEHCESLLTSENNTHLSSFPEPLARRKRRSSVEEEQSSAPPAKRQSLSEEDIQLLNSY